jgi:CelD/BcsL family acetyltransferase involved in cellulose biosynthesis
MAALVDLHTMRSQGKSRAFASERYIGFHNKLVQALLAKDWVRLFSLDVGHRSAAVIYNFAYGDRHYFYQSGRDPNYAKHRVGLVLMHRVIQEAIGEHATVFDFLRGEEDYKYRWATEKETNLRLLYCKSVSARLRHRFADALEGIRREDWVGKIRRLTSG